MSQKLLLKTLKWNENFLLALYMSKYCEIFFTYMLFFNAKICMEEIQKFQTTRLHPYRAAFWF